MNSRPAYEVPGNLSPAIAKLIADASARKWVWVNERGEAFWLNEQSAKEAHAKKGGNLFAPEH